MLYIDLFFENLFNSLINNIVINNKKIFISVLLAVIVVVGIISFTADNKANTSGLKIGVTAPLTGDFGGVGENVVKGIRTAQAVYAEKTGNKIEIIVEDDSADAVKGLSAYQKLTKVDQVDGLINTFTSTMDAIYDQVVKAEYPVMMEFFQANNVADDNVFQMTLGNDNVWDRYAKYISGAEYDDSKVVVVHSTDAAQDSFAKAFTAEYKKPVTTVVASTDKGGLRTDAAKIAALKPSMIIFFMTPENGAILTKEVLPLISSNTQLVYDIQLFTGISYYQAQLGGDLSRINGAINLMFEGDPKSAENIEFVTAYKKLYPNEEPGFLADYGYDTFMTYVNTYSPDNAKWTANLKAEKSDGASGEILFDQNGIRIPSLVVKQVIDGKSVTVARLAI
jgi:ABC-type branched-subunit amino acid transport system substrate-binding protein